MDLSDYLRSLADDSKKVLMSEARQLSGLDRARAADFGRAWPAIPLERRRKIVQGLVDLAEDNVELDFNAVLRACLSDADAEVRARAIDGLWEDEASSTGLALLGLLARDPSERVRSAAAAGLARFVYRAELGELAEPTARRIREGLLAAIADESGALEVRRRAVESIGYLSQPEVGEVIRRAYAAPEARMRASAVFAMGRNCDPAWLDTIVAEMKSPSAEMRYEAARAAGELEDQRAVRPLVPLLADEDREVRLAATAALGQIGGETALKALRYVLKTGDDEARAAAAEAIGELTLAEDPLGLRAPAGD